MGWNHFRDAATRAQWRAQLMREQSGRCALCGHRFPEPTVADPAVYRAFAPTFDHIVPRVRGGSDAFDNLRLVHRACNLLRGDSEDLKRPPPLPKSLTTEPGDLPHKVRTNAQGERWCNNRRWKRVYPSLEAAWLGVLRSFLETGRITTPYRCNRSRYSYAIPRFRITANPWAYEPYIYWVGSINHRVVGCSLWHLTTHTGHLLGRAASPPALPKPMGWEAYHRAADGAWVRRDRECVRSDGTLKKCFATLEDAQRCAGAMSAPEEKRGRRYHTYICSNGHVHIGTSLA